MPYSTSSTSITWTIQDTSGFDSLMLDKNAPVTQPGDYECLVKFHAASLNYRDLIIPKAQYLFAQEDGVIPGSDGEGEVVAVGPKVKSQS